MPKKANSIISTVLNLDENCSGKRKENLKKCVESILKDTYGEEVVDKLIMGDDNTLIPNGDIARRLTKPVDFKAWCEKVVDFVFENNLQNLKLPNDVSNQINDVKSVCGNINQMKELEKLKEVYNKLPDIISKIEKKREYRNQVGKDNLREIRNNIGKVRPLLDHCYDDKKIEPLENKIKNLMSVLNKEGKLNECALWELALIVLARSVRDSECAKNLGYEDWHYYWLRDAIRDAGKGDGTLPLCLTRGDVAVFLYLLLGLASVARGTQGQPTQGG